MNPSVQIDHQIAQYPDWRGKLLAQLRQLINAADSSLKEDWKWGTAVWTAGSNICAIAAFKDHVKVNFFNGVNLTDPKHLINSGLDSKQNRAIDFYEGDKLDKSAFQNLVRAAVKLAAK